MGLTLELFRTKKGSGGMKDFVLIGRGVSCLISAEQDALHWLGDNKCLACGNGNMEKIKKFLNVSAVYEEHQERLLSEVKNRNTTND